MPLPRRTTDDPDERTRRLERNLAVLEEALAIKQRARLLLVVDQYAHDCKVGWSRAYKMVMKKERDGSERTIAAATQRSARINRAVLRQVMKDRQITMAAIAKIDARASSAMSALLNGGCGLGPKRAVRVRNALTKIGFSTSEIAAVFCETDRPDY